MRCIYLPKKKILNPFLGEVEQIGEMENYMNLNEIRESVLLT